MDLNTVIIDFILLRRLVLNIGREQGSDHFLQLVFMRTYSNYLFLGLMS
jgi:hypothetical protein